MKSESQDPAVVIVIPIYQSVLSEAEKLSLRQCLKVLGRYPVRVVKPQGLDVSNLKKEFPSLEYSSFDDAFFKGVDAYNKLMISADFYRTFSAYEFMLIYQLDAYVFKDTLADWCRKGLDYIGAPSLHQEKYDQLPAGSEHVFAEALSSNRFVLNGGLSLRRIPAFLRYLKIYNLFYPQWLGNEDMLFSQEATRLLPMKMFLKLPSWQEALYFAFEKSPAATYKITGHQLPFACHAWERYDPEFWKRFIP